MTRDASRNLMRSLVEVQTLVHTTWATDKPGHWKKAAASHYTCQSSSTRSLNFIKQYARRLARSLHFNECEIKLLMLLYQQLGAGNVFAMLPEDDLKSFMVSQFDITDPMALEGISRAFRSSSRVKEISVEDFLLGLSVFLRGTVRERARFCFKAYDIDSDGHLKRKEELHKFLSDSFDPHSEAVLSEIDPDEPVRETINYLWRKLIPSSANPKSQIGLSKYMNLCMSEPVLMECLTSVFPPDSKVLTFQRMLFCRYYTTSYLTTKAGTTGPLTPRITRTISHLH